MTQTTVYNPTLQYPEIRRALIDQDEQTLRECLQRSMLGYGLRTMLLESKALAQVYEAYSFEGAEVVYQGVGLRITRKDGFLTTWKLDFHDRYAPIETIEEASGYGQEIMSKIASMRIS